MAFQAPKKTANHTKPFRRKNKNAKTPNFLSQPKLFLECMVQYCAGKYIIKYSNSNFVLRNYFFSEEIT